VPTLRPTTVTGMTRCTPHPRPDLSLASLVVSPTCEGLYALAAQLVMLSTVPHLDLLVIRGLTPAVRGAAREDLWGGWGAVYAAADLPADLGPEPQCSALLRLSAQLVRVPDRMTPLVHAGRVLSVTRGATLNVLRDATLRHALTIDRTRHDPPPLQARARHHSLMHLDAAAARVTFTPERLPVHDWDAVPEFPGVPAGFAVDEPSPPAP